MPSTTRGGEKARDRVLASRPTAGSPTCRPPFLFITTDDDRLVPPDESRALYDRAGEPKKLVVLEGYGHYEVYAEPAFGEVMRETVAWFREHLPPA